MQIRRVLQSRSLKVFDFRCSAGPSDAPFTERHSGFALSYVRRGSFSYRTRGEAHELVAGSFLLGRGGDEYVCSHEHHGFGDECLSFHFSDELVDGLGGPRAIWRRGSLPPLAELMVLGELGQAAADGTSDLGADEVGLRIAARVAEVMTQRKDAPRAPGARDRKRAVEAALWIDDRSRE
ncbi:MAG: AraC family transcriptional regulator, partial [Deltaproteobacteria bacterium]|nr:AraC family transcriptional regulator [Deltaproteobacteria bacterium]